MCMRHSSWPITVPLDGPAARDQDKDLGILAGWSGISLVPPRRPFRGEETWAIGGIFLPVARSLVLFRTWASVEGHKHQGIFYGR